MDVYYTILDILRASLLFAVPLTVVALAGLFSERSGVVNIALEGIMVMGAFIGAFFISKIEENTGYTGQSVLFIAMIVAALSGMAFSALHAFASVNMKANQIISATAMNMFAPAFALLISRTSSGFAKVSYSNTDFLIRDSGFLSDIPIIGDVFFTNTYTVLWVGIILAVVSYLVLYKTTFGLRMRSCGEHPQAADSAGINVYKMRWSGVLISGALAGLGGLFYIVPLTGNYDPTFAVSGTGFLALAVLISGQWKPSRIVAVAFLFAFALVLKNNRTSFDFLSSLGIPGEIYSILPYLATLVVLTFTSKNSQGPKAAGEVYDPGKR